jgi:C4-type Zn-finger protein
MNPEREKEDLFQKTPEGVLEHVNEIPEEIESLEGVKRTVSKFSTNVTDDRGQSLIQSDDNKKVTITISSDDATLKNQSKGDSQDSQTWNAVFLLRMIKKAFINGWEIIRGRRE